MKNWRTTIAGLVVFIPVAMDAILEAYNAGAFTSKSGLQLFVAIGAIVLARLAKDHNVVDVIKPEPQADDIGGGGIKNPPPPPPNPEDLGGH